MMPLASQVLSANSAPPTLLTIRPLPAAYKRHIYAHALTSNLLWDINSVTTACYVYYTMHLELPVILFLNFNKISGH